MIYQAMVRIYTRFFVSYNELDLSEEEDSFIVSTVQNSTTIRLRARIPTDIQNVNDEGIQLCSALNIVMETMDDDTTVPPQLTFRVDFKLGGWKADR